MRQVTHALLTRPPLSHSSNRSNQSASLDLHVLSTPPAFILSQDQTLVKNMFNQLLHWINNQVCSGIKKTTSFLYPFYCFIGCIFLILFWIILCLEFSGMLSIVQLSMFFVVVFRDSHIRLSHLSSLVNNFFNLFFTVLYDSFVSRDSFVRISPLPTNVNTIFQLFLMFLSKYNSKKTGGFTPPALSYINPLQ